MIRAVLIAATIVVAIVVAPYSQTPGFNSADAIVVLAPIAVVLIVAWPARPERRPVSRHYGRNR